MIPATVSVFCVGGGNGSGGRRKPGNSVRAAFVCCGASSHGTDCCPGASTNQIKELCHPTFFDIM